MGRFTKIAVPEEFIDYSRKLPETLLLAAVNKIDSGIAANDALVDVINNKLNIKVAPNEQAQKMYKDYTDSLISQKNAILDDIENDPLNYSKHNAKLKRLASDINEKLTIGELKAIQEQGASYYSKEAELKTTYKDNPELYALAKKRLDEGLQAQTYNTDLNTFGELESPKMAKHYKIEDITKHVGDIVKAVESEFGLTKDKVMKLFTTNSAQVLGLPDIEIKAREKLIDSLKSMPSDFIESLNQDNVAKNRVGADGNFIDERNFYSESTGTFNLDTELGKILHSYSTAGVYSKGQVMAAPIDSNPGGRKRGNGNEETQDIIHPWGNAISALKTLHTVYSKCPDSTCKQQTSIQIRDLVLKTTLNSIQEESWKDTREYKETGGIVHPFVALNKASAKDDDIVYDFNQKKIFVRRPNSQHGVSTGASRAIENLKIYPGLGSITSPLTQHNYTTYDMTLQKDRESFAKYAYQVGYQSLRYAPSLESAFNAKVAKEAALDE